MAEGDYGFVGQAFPRIEDWPAIWMLYAGILEQQDTANMHTVILKREKLQYQGKEWRETETCLYTESSAREPAAILGGGSVV